MTEENYCSYLKELPKNSRDTLRAELYTCQITGQRCVAASFEDPDPFDPRSIGCEASYNDSFARLYCPTYNLPDDFIVKISELREECRKDKIKETK